MTKLTLILANASQEPEIKDIIPKIMEIMNGRLTQAYIKLNESSQGNPLLRHISALVSRVNTLSQAVTGHPPSHYT